MFPPKVVVVIVVYLFYGLPQMQSHEITLDSFTPFKSVGQPLADYGTVRLSKKGRNSYDVSGNFTLLRNVGRQFRTSFEFGRLSGDSVLLLVKMEREFCEFYTLDARTLEALRNVSNFPPKGTCPFPKGRYHIEGFGVNEHHFPPADLPGAYAMKFIVSENGRNVGGFSLQESPDVTTTDSAGRRASATADKQFLKSIELRLKCLTKRTAQLLSPSSDSRSLGEESPRS
ncbi:uncharacterized protein LOC131681106 [Topomyia yanbarensis]|uniref:uncharacterized protein LOC131681106 n=1 Tax=Topomyia yanbarensis TaxID=2498891 RepID=UPI00273B6F86|nr:uncharacterized protein LOC131681106 [Topomyia yanbarensis]